jgi:hypothetical protein
VHEQPLPRLGPAHRSGVRVTKIGLLLFKNTLYENENLIEMGKGKVRKFLWAGWVEMK